MTTTLVVSDLHLGSRSRSDLLRGRPAVLDALRARLTDVDRFVLLGDTLELRHGPRREALAGARELMGMLGEAMAGREVVIVAGNHDHPLIADFVEARALDEPAPLGSERRFAPAQGSATLAALAEMAAPAQLTAAYPGLWLSDDVYALHGHYLDCHIVVPTIERIGIAAMARFRRRPLSDIASIEDYEAATAPVYAWIDGIAAHAPTGSTLNGDATARAWRALRPVGGRRRTLRSRALAGAFPLGVAALNAAGLGPLRPTLSGEHLRRAGLQAMGDVVARLGIAAGHVIFGHTHRAGPLEGDDLGEWTARDGRTRLYNCGSWTYDWWAADTDARRGPYWPGTCVVVPADGGAPRVEGLLDGLAL